MNVWVRLRQSFWFVPALLCVAAVVLAEGLILVDRQLDEADLGVFDVVVTRVGESGSRDLLGAIAGSMLAVASTTFSITIAVLALSSSTYGPRLVRNFMADRGNQVVLGIFVATFLYSLMVLRSIRVLGDGDEEYFVPHLAVNAAVLLAVASIGVLVYFIHHISDSVQVWTLADLVRTDLLDVVDRLYPEDVGDATGGSHGVQPGSWPEDAPGATTTLRALETGYVQGVDLESLMSGASEQSLVVAVQVRVGQHVTRDGILAVVRATDEVGDAVLGSVRNAISLGRARTPHQDVEFSMLLLEEMAVRALSPSTNDPYTAINALDSLASGLVELAGRPTPSPYRYDSDGQLRVIAPCVELGDLLDHLLNAMRWHATTHPTVLHRTLELVAAVGEACRDPAVLLLLADHTRYVVDAFAASSPHVVDLTPLSRHAAGVREGLRARAEVLPGKQDQAQPPKT